MKNIPSFEEFLDENYEAIYEGSLTVTDKDWDRMTDLVLKGDTNGEKVAKLIKDKNKAMARFVAGLKLNNSPLRYEDNKWSPYRSSSFSRLGDLALELGATPQEIQDLYDSTNIPSSIIEKMNKRSGKKLNNEFVGVISKAVLDAGFDINYNPHNGNAITFLGKEAMQKNGRKWTIGYKSEISANGKKYKLVFDAITDEGFGPTYYVIDGGNSDKVFYDIFPEKTYGKNEFVAKLKEILKSLK